MGISLGFTQLYPLSTLMVLKISVQDLKIRFVVDTT